jgi:hypothetical protein
MYSQTVNGHRREVYMHRLIMLPPYGSVVDHVDGNRLNNCRANLRVCSPQQNLRYRRCFANNESGYKGVSQHHQRWVARLWMDKQRIHLGTYTTAEQAASAYDCAARLLFKSFALLNFPDQPTPPTVRDAVMAKLEACRLDPVRRVLRNLGLLG